MRGRTYRGFTLIELLVVVAIIALLMSILLPSLSQARKQAQAVKCMSDMRQIMLGLQMYQHDHKGRLPWTLWSEYDHNYPTLNDAAPKAELWFYKLVPTYVGHEGVFVCPSDPFRSQFNFSADHPSKKHWRLNVPSCGYGMNYLLRHFDGLGPRRRAYNVEAFAPARPSSTILLAEVGPDDQLPQTPLMQGMGQAWRDGGRIVWDDGARPWYSGPTWITTRHLGGINMSAMDFSIKRVRTADVIRRANAEGIRTQYPDCKNGNCYFCNFEQTEHYSFAHADMYWWTGKKPQYNP